MEKVVVILNYNLDVNMINKINKPQEVISCLTYIYIYIERERETDRQTDQNCNSMQNKLLLNYEEKPPRGDVESSVILVTFHDMI